MAQETKHTPLQWNNNLKDGHVYCSGGIQVATCYSSFRGPETIKANAELIVKAVNNHDKLVDMLQELLKIHTYSTYGDNVWRLLVAERAEQLLQSLKG